MSTMKVNERFIEYINEGKIMNSRTYFKGIVDSFSLLSVLDKVFQ
jgi:hypothetical protein